MPLEKKLIHDIKNCLNALKLNSHCLEMFEPAEVVECMDALTAAADKMNRLISQIDEAAPERAPDPVPSTNV